MSPVCYNKYIGKNWKKYYNENKWKQNRTWSANVSTPHKYSQFAEYSKFYALPDVDVVNTIVSKELHLDNVVTENTEIIDHNNNWGHLQDLEADFIKTMSPELNIGLKA